MTFDHEGFEQRQIAKDAALREDRDPESYVFVHDGFCNDYTGCNAGCTSAKLKDAVWRMGAWRDR